MTSYVMGIDGGGTSVRVVVTDTTLAILGEAQGETVNPSSVGREVCSARIQTAIRDAIASAHIAPHDIRAVGIGVAGASASHSEGLLREMVTGALPRAIVVPSSDYEIALVGAHGKREGILLLAGTGSLAYGVNSSGENVLVGGWGYLLGDEGSGYWIGMEALKAVARAADSVARLQQLTDIVLSQFQLQAPRDLIPWLYRAQTTRVPDIAALAPLVINADTDEARRIIREAATWLVQSVTTASSRLQMQGASVALHGGLLSHDNPLRAGVCDMLRHNGFEVIDTPRYSAAIGAAIVALDALQSG